MPMPKPASLMAQLYAGCVTKLHKIRHSPFYQIYAALLRPILIRIERGEF